MDRIKLPYILVVEGATDQAFLSRFLDCDYIQTNGSEVSRETIEYIREASKKRDVVLLLDPDGPGERIRARILDEVPECKQAFVRKDRSIRGKKVGVAESSRKEVLHALSHIMPSFDNVTGTLTMADLCELGLIGSDGAVMKRRIVSERFHLGEANAKTMLKRLNAMNVSREQIEEALHG